MEIFPQLVLYTILLSFTINYYVHGVSTSYPITTFGQSFIPSYGNNILLDNQGNSVQISLDQTTGSGFESRESYYHGYFSAGIKLPSNYTAGVVVTFYSSNDKFYGNGADEIDFEFLGNIQGQNWILQTNIYGYGSRNRGREERYNLWFDPTLDFHDYSILWVRNSIIFYVDNLPIRETRSNYFMGMDFPSRSMFLYGTIWDGSSWATYGGRFRVRYEFAPFKATYRNFILQNGPDFEKYNGLTNQERWTMRRIRYRYLIYSYCRDRRRYRIPLPECVSFFNKK